MFGRSKVLSLSFQMFLCVYCISCFLGPRVRLDTDHSVTHFPLFEGGIRFSPKFTKRRWIDKILYKGGGGGVCEEKMDKCQHVFFPSVRTGIKCGL